jgi:hypothetical protein
MILVTALLAMVGSAPAGASGPDSATAGGSTKAAIMAPSTASLEWSGPVQLEVESGPQEIVVRFDQPLSDVAIANFAAVAGGDLADFRWNDTSLVLQPAAGRQIEASVNGSRLQVTFRPDETASEAQPADADGNRADVELALAQAQADAAAGFTGQARKRLASLAQDYPNDLQVQRVLADTEAADGAIGVAARRYQKIAATDRAAKRIMAEANGSLTSSSATRAGDSFSQVDARLIDGRIQLSSGFAISGGLRQVRTRADNVISSAGELSDVTANYLVGELSADMSLGSSASLILLGAGTFDGGPFGASARFNLGSQERQARLIVAYRLPDFLTAEQSVLGGYINRVGLGGAIRLTPELTAQGDLGWTAYGLRHSGTAARTLTAAGGFDYLLRRGSPSFAVTYRLDAEHVLNRVKAGGQILIPLTDRENHSVLLISSMRLVGLQFTGAAGWTTDRKGDFSGPSASAGAVAQLGDTWRIETVAGISSVSRPAFPGRQTFLRLSISRSLRGL